MASSVIAGACGIGLAYFMYRLKPELPSLIADRFAGLHRLLRHKYYIDELYDLILVQPTLRFSRGVLLRVVDLGCIEGVVNGLPRLIGQFALRLRKIQDGQVSHYLAWMGGGAFILLTVLLIAH